ncbi:MAG TPA: hypothetical protein VGO58_08440 [Chitinophagaceae bacterium]|jgi:hypothetical protein|nr:hypothetical protein [Chitinophagaceae bacterium]
MKKTVLILAGIVTSIFSPAQVGIGTNSPSPNAILDMTSTDRGMMLPRINDTTNVLNPSAGLMIYNIAAARPAYHDGNRWNTFLDNSTSLAAAGDSITYTITGAVSGFTNGTYDAKGLNLSATGGGSPADYSPLILLKDADINSVGFVRAMSIGIGTTGMVIEVKFYKHGESTPYYSIKLTAPIVAGVLSGSTSSTAYTESFQLYPNIIGFKDWINNKSFGFNRNSHLEVAY